MGSSAGSSGLLMAITEAARAAFAGERLVCTFGALHGVVDGERDGDFGRERAGIGHAVAQDGDGEAGIVGIVRDEGREGFERDSDGQRAILEVDAGQREILR